jgi:chromate transporter
MIVPALGQIVSIFVRIGSFTFGGGNATVAALEHEIVERRRWMERPGFRLAFGLSRITPGTTMLATCTALGWCLRKWRGAIAALCGSSVPCSALAIAITGAYVTWIHNPIAIASFRGAAAAAVGLMCGSSWQLLRPFLDIDSWIRIAVLVGGSAVLASYSMPPVRVLCIAVAVGLIWREKETA